MVRIGFQYQLISETEKSNIFRFEKLITNSEAMEILEELENDGTFESMYDDGMNCLIRVREDIEQSILAVTDFNRLYRQYGTNDPFDVFELHIEFNPELHKNYWEDRG